MTDNLEIRAGRGGEWGIAHDRGLVLIRFRGVSEGQVFTCELTPAVAVQMAQSLINHAMQASGDGEPVTITIGDPP
jgi:hypothetical protein